MVLVVQVYAPGFNAKNLKTITVDVPDVFELVSTTEEGVDTGIYVDVQNIVDSLPDGDAYSPYYDDTYVSNGQVASNDNTLVLNRTDGQSVNVDLSSISGWYEGD